MKKTELKKAHKLITLFTSQKPIWAVGPIAKELKMDKGEVLILLEKLILPSQVLVRTDQKSSRTIMRSNLTEYQLKNKSIEKQFRKMKRDTNDERIKSLNIRFTFLKNVKWTILTFSLIIINIFAFYDNYQIKKGLEKIISDYKIVIES